MPWAGFHPATEPDDLMTLGRGLEEDDYERLTPWEKQSFKRLVESATSLDMVKYLGI